MAMMHGRPEPKGWTKSDATRVIASARDRRLAEASGTYGGRSEEVTRDTGAWRLAELERLLPLRDWQALRKWRLDQMAALGLRIDHDTIC
jgi:hypothetical protein